MERKVEESSRTSSYEMAYVIIRPKMTGVQPARLTELGSALSPTLDETAWPRARPNKHCATIRTMLTLEVTPTNDSNC